MPGKQYLCPPSSTSDYIRKLLRQYERRFLRLAIRLILLVAGWVGLYLLLFKHGLADDRKVLIGLNAGFVLCGAVLSLLMLRMPANLKRDIELGFIIELEPGSAAYKFYKEYFQKIDALINNGLVYESSKTTLIDTLIRQVAYLKNARVDGALESCKAAMCDAISVHTCRRSLFSGPAAD